MSALPTPPPACPCPPILVISSEADRYYAQSRHLIRCLEHSAIPHELIHWSREKSPRTTHVFEELVGLAREPGDQ